MHERPLRRAAPQHFEVVANGGKGPLAPSTAHKPSASLKLVANNEHSQCQSWVYVRNATDQ
jgi:hypothetical protein